MKKCYPRRHFWCFHFLEESEGVEGYIPIIREKGREGDPHLVQTRPYASSVDAQQSETILSELPTTIDSPKRFCPSCRLRSTVRNDSARAADYDRQSEMIPPELPTTIDSPKRFRPSCRLRSTARNDFVRVADYDRQSEMILPELPTTIDSPKRFRPNCRRQSTARNDSAWVGQGVGLLA